MRTRFHLTLIAVGVGGSLAALLALVFAGALIFLVIVGCLAVFALGIGLVGFFNEPLGHRAYDTAKALLAVAYLLYLGYHVVHYSGAGNFILGGLLVAFVLGYALYERGA